MAWAKSGDCRGLDSPHGGQASAAGRRWRKKAQWQATQRDRIIKAGDKPPTDKQLLFIKLLNDKYDFSGTERPATKLEAFDIIEQLKAQIR